MGQARAGDRQPRRAVLIGTGLVLAAVWTAISSLGDVRASPVAFVALYAVAFAAYAVAVRAVLRGATAPLAWILIPALVCRAVALPAPASDDMNRYLWEGRVQLAGFDPYGEAPDSAALAHLASDDEYHDGVNHPSWTAIYPPVTMLWHRAVAAVSYTPWAMKASFVGAELILVALLAALLRAHALPTERLLIYLWSPLAVLSVAHQGHHEPIAMALLLGALLAVERGHVALAGALLAPAILAKGFAAATLPAWFGRRYLRGWIAGAVIGILAIAPFVASGSGLGRSLLAFGGQLHYNDSLHALAALATGPDVSRVLMIVVWIALAIRIHRHGPSDPVHRCAVLLAGLLVVLPTVHPWYLLIVLPFLCFFPWWGWLALTGTVALTWLPYLEIATTGEWVEWPWLRLPEYLPLYAWLGHKAWTSRRSVVTTP